MTDLEISFQNFYDKNTFLHGYSKSILYHVYKYSVSDKNELILSFQQRYSGALELIKELEKENEKLKEENKDLLDRVASR
jgi:hypothetical protein